jgi:PEGA domain
MEPKKSLFESVSTFVNEHKRFSVGVVIFVLVLLVYDIFFKSSDVVITVNVTPETASVYVNDIKEAKIGSIKKALPKGTYQIVVTEAGYLTKSQSVQLTKDTTLTVSLDKLSDISVQTNAPPAPSISLGEYFDVTPISATSFYAIDPRSKFLVKVSNETSSTIFASKISGYSVGDKVIAVMETIGNNYIVSTINTVTGKATKMKTEVLSPISSISVSNDDKKVFIVGSYSPFTRKSIVYETPVDRYDPKVLLNIGNTHISALDQDHYIEFYEGEALDDSKIVVVEASSGKEVYSSTANNYFISPNGTSVAAITSNSVSTFNVLTNIKKETPVRNSGLAAWKDEDILVIFTNTSSGSDFFYLDTRNDAVSPVVFIEDLAGNGVGSVEGVVDNTAYITDLNGQLRIIKLQ